ncbi:transposase [Streptomyces sp. 8N706]|uniref:transposase n=1 Tax=Streptomyces sp. 8N706 TaxID=3457416 RepID=UPI003FD65D9E
MSKRYSAEFKRDAVALVRSPGRNVTAARELGVSAEGLRNWVRQDDTDRSEGPAGALTSAEEEELRRLRRQNREQPYGRHRLAACPRSPDRRQATSRRLARAGHPPLWPLPPPHAAQ